MTQSLYLTDNSTPHTFTANKISTEDAKPPVVSKAELNRIIRNIRQNKAPGYDFIDYNLIKIIHKEHHNYCYFTLSF